VQSIGRARNCGTPRCGVLDRADLAVTKMQISPVIVNGFENGLQQWIQRIFLVAVEAEKLVSEIFFKKLDPLCGPVAAKPLVLELLCLEVGTSVHLPELLKPF